MSACTDLAPVETEGEKVFAPAAIYREWYEEVEQCTGLSGRFERVTWIEAEVRDADGQRRSGVWRPPHTIYLDPRIVRADCDTTPGGGPCFRQQNVKHEIIHDLRQGGHDEPYPDPTSVFIRCSSV